MSNKLAAKMMADNTEKFLNEIDALEDRNNKTLQFLRVVVSGWKDGTLAPDRIQILENGDMRILPGEPPDQTNGKGAIKDVPLLTEPSVAEPVGVSSGN